uniref:Uncharacterized protein n=1 Tax=Romanomermis culicivorax TaxID=13658 RepID=A0A915J997_ROMCU
KVLPDPSDFTTQKEEIFDVNSLTFFTEKRQTPTLAQVCSLNFTFSSSSPVHSVPSDKDQSEKDVVFQQFPLVLHLKLMQFDCHLLHDQNVMINNKFVGVAK